LHERTEDIYPLFRKFAVDFAEKYRTDSLELDEKARYILEHYRWPGNVRELKNVVEQFSVLAENKLLTESIIAELAPQLISRNLPVGISAKETEGFAEREILYKFLLDMKGDLNDLKNLVFNLIKTNNLNVPESNIGKFVVPAEMPVMNDGGFYTLGEDEESATAGEISRPIILNDSNRDRYHKSEVVEEALSLEEMEKDMIKKALKKFAGKRKDAADELGISERTLYRKIKQYDIPD